MTRMSFRFRSAFLGLVVAVIAGCGFQLRGAYHLPYASIYLATGDTSVIGAGLSRNIRASGGVLADSAQAAEAIFQPTVETRKTETLSYSSSGRARERRLRYTYGYRITDNKGRDFVLPSSVELIRDLTYADSSVLAKTQEEDLLWRDMENDLVQQLMRRLATAKPAPPVSE